MNHRLKQIVYILLLLLVLAACTGRHVDDAPLLPELQLAEELMFPYPDSALHVLQRMPVPSERDRLQHATWALLLSHALYKNDIKQNDSLVNIACDYFLPRNDAERKALALYVKGCIYDEANRQDETLPLLLQASEGIAKTTDYRLGLLVSSKIAVPSLSDSELQTCCLIKMGLGVSDMAEVLNISPTSVSKRKNRIKEQVVRSIGTSMEKLNLDLWLRTF